MIGLQTHTEKKGLTAKIYMYDHNTDAESRAGEVRGKAGDVVEINQTDFLSSSTSTQLKIASALFSSFL